jgi:hypothetical protein
VIPQRPAIAFRHGAVSAKVGKISSNGIVLVTEALRSTPADEAIIVAQMIAAPMTAAHMIAAQ